MSERTAKRLRREHPELADKPKQFTPPVLIPVPTGEIDDEGNEITAREYFPRKLRRQAFRMMMADIKKGRYHDRRSQA